MIKRAFRRTATLEMELAEPISDRHGLGAYEDALVLARLHGEPVASVRVPLERGTLPRDTFIHTLAAGHGDAFARLLARRALRAGHCPAGIDPAPLAEPLAAAPAPQPLVTVAVCTRDRADDLARCLDALMELDYPNLDLLVVDNAPSSDATLTLVRDRYPRARYIREPRAGLDWARNRAIIEARGEIIAYTDDDVAVDRHWVSALVRVFGADDTVMAVTGLVLPFELGTPAQELFETYGGFGRGYRRRWFKASDGRVAALEFGGAGAFGTGANMAFRRRVFDLIGGFDPALDVGTCTNGGGDLEMFFRVLKEGHVLVYEPAAIVRHRHRPSYSQLRTQIANNGVGFYAYLVRTALTYTDERLGVLRLGTWWFAWWSVRRAVRRVLGREAVPLDLIFAELVGSVRGLFRYPRARAQAARVAAAHPLEPSLPAAPPPRAPGARRFGEAIRRVDIAERLQPIADAGAYRRVRLFVFWRGMPLGHVIIDHDGAPVSVLRVEDAIVDRLPSALLDARQRLGEQRFWHPFIAAVKTHLSGEQAATAPSSAESGELPLSADVAVTVIVATRDRPDDLHQCLASLVAQRTSRPLEIVVVDNNPASGVTPDVVRRFPGVVLVSEARAGLSYARNRGILAATGSIVATTDDDVVCPPDWIENLVRPFRRSDIMVVTGNVLPMELDTEPQLLFETYGGLGRGFSPWVADRQWFKAWHRAVPTWELGCTANAAFRRSIFSHATIGLMDEALGAGTPTGCSEDTYVFYRVLKAGYAIAYEPRAYVWHRHRRTYEALRNQIHSYSKGHVAYHLLTLLRERDVRALVRLVYEMPIVYARRAFQRLRRRTDYPLALILVEVLGMLQGPWALWQSRQRVRRLGRSGAIDAEGLETKRAIA